jgi:hypothetical protein
MMLMGIIGAVGGLFAADKLHDYATRSLGQKVQVGDVAFVSAASLRPAVGAAGNVPFEISLMQGTAAGALVPVRVTSLGRLLNTTGGGSRDISGTTLGQIALTVEFHSGSVQRLQRNGVDVQPGFSRIY